MTIYAKLEAKYGSPLGQWGLWCRGRKTASDREEIVIGAILAQNTSWHNAEMAISNLKSKNLLSLCAISRCSKNRLLELIKPAGFFNQKADYLFNVAKYFTDNGGLKEKRKLSVECLRLELLSLKGVGRETADSIILYACDLPIFVVDEYTRRFARRLRLTSRLDYQPLQNYFQKRLDTDVRMWQYFHALIVISEKNL